MFNDWKWVWHLWSVIVCLHKNWFIRSSVVWHFSHPWSGSRHWFFILSTFHIFFKRTQKQYLLLLERKKERKKERRKVRKKEKGHKEAINQRTHFYILFVWLWYCFPPSVGRQKCQDALRTAGTTCHFSDHKLDTARELRGIFWKFHFRSLNICNKIVLKWNFLTKIFSRDNLYKHVVSIRKEITVRHPLIKWRTVHCQ